MEGEAVTSAQAVVSDIVVSVAKDFNAVPGGRFPWEGPNSGQEFRENVLRQRYDDALNHRAQLIVELDGTAGYASSFLEEAFGGLVRKRHADKGDLLSRLVVVSRDQPKWVNRVTRYIEQAQPE
jgi:hypothetical protein